MTNSNKKTAYHSIVHKVIDGSSTFPICSPTLEKRNRVNGWQTALYLIAITLAYKHYPKTQMISHRSVFAHRKHFSRLSFKNVPKPHLFFIDRPTKSNPKNRTIIISIIPHFCEYPKICIFFITLSNCQIDFAGKINFRVLEYIIC